MEFKGKPRTDKCREIISDWNFGDSCKKTSLPVWDIGNIRHWLFVAQNARIVNRIRTAIEEEISGCTDPNATLCKVTLTFPVLFVISVYCTQGVLFVYIQFDYHL